jgi:hypothetical protein
MGARPAVRLLFALWILYGFGYLTAWQRLETQVQGTVVSSRDVPSTGAPRYATYYMIRGKNEQNSSYVAGCTDASLPRSLPVGTQLIKKKWDWGYQINGEYERFENVRFLHHHIGSRSRLSVVDWFQIWLELDSQFQGLRIRLLRTPHLHPPS